MNLSSIKLRRDDSDYTISKILKSNAIDITKIDKLIAVIYETNCISIIHPTTNNVSSNILSQESGWNMLMVIGQLDFELSGILNSLLTPIAKAKISVLVMSSFDTDYIFIKKSDIDTACKQLELSGVSIKNEELIND